MIDSQARPTRVCVGRAWTQMAAYFCAEVMRALVLCMFSVKLD